MKLLLDRKWKKDTYVIGNLYINGKLFCNTIEDRDRGLTQDMPLSKIKEVKVAAKTAIPTGKYNITLNVISPKFSLRPWYVKNCHGARVPRLLDVPGYAGILIHTGNTERNSAGCIIVGKNNVKGMVTDSKAVFLSLYNKMYSAYKKGEKITIEIK